MKSFLNILFSAISFYFPKSGFFLKNFFSKGGDSFLSDPFNKGSLQMAEKE